MLPAPVPVEVFCCYAHSDEKRRAQLEKHLSALKLNGLISFWHDRRILPGANWSEAIDHHLETASIILLLISANFIASDYCSTVEMKRALERHTAHKARVIPIVVSSCDWHHLPIGKLQALPKDARPINKWTPIDDGWTQVATGLRRIIEDFSQIGGNIPSREGQLLVPAESSDISVDRIREVLAACYRRAVFTRFHAQLDAQVMLDSLAECRSTLQRIVVFVEPEKLQRLVAGIIGELDLIERIGKEPSTRNDLGTRGTIDGAKLRIINALVELSKVAPIPFILPTSITEELFWSKEDADKPPKVPKLTNTGSTVTEA